MIFAIVYMTIAFIHSFYLVYLYHFIRNLHVVILTLGLDVFMILNIVKHIIVLEHYILIDESLMVQPKH